MFKGFRNPNILFILSDDQGAWAMGCSGNNEIKTPNLDRLATRGIRFENFFCTSPVCSPARASLLTGQIPSQHGVHDWISGGNGVNDKGIEYLKGPLSYTDILNENGYNCGLSGKWHLGDSINPQKGFKHWYVHQTGGGNYYNAPMIREGKFINENGYVTDAITDDALSFIDSNCKEERPFYLGVHYTAPHSPWINNHPKEYVELYEDCKFNTFPIESPHPWARYNELRHWFDNPIENLKGYYAAITAMDMNIGRLLNKLEEKELVSDTLIVFLSDNGFNCGQHGIWGKGNGTFPFNMYDTSVKVPAIMSHPGIIPQGVVTDAMVSGYDFMPTLLKYVGLKNSEADKLPGRSFLNVLLGKEEGNRESVVVFDEYGPVRMIRTKEWKYVHRYPYGPNELYDLLKDPNEAKNLIDEKEYYHEKVKLKAQLDKWFIEYVNPEIDGTKEGVTGNGQCQLAGVKAEGKDSYDSW